MAAWLCFHCLCSASSPPFSLTCSFPLCVCGQQQKSGTPEEDQLVTHCLYLPGLSTTLGLDLCVQSCDVMVLLLHVFCVFAFVLMYFSLLSSTVIFFVFCSVFRSCVHLASSTPAPLNLPCLPACLLSTPIISSTSPSSSVC